MIVDSHSSPTTIEVPVPARGAAFPYLKRVVQHGFLLLALPRLVCYWVGRALLGPRAFISSAESIAQIPGLRGVYLRQAFYRCLLAECGRDVCFSCGTVFSMTEARVGQRVYIGRSCSVGFADIGDEAMLADRVQVLSGGREHDRDDATTALSQQAQTYSQVRIGKGAWVGAGAIIMADVGDHAIIGAGAVVNRPVPAGAIAAGVPARVVNWREGWA